MNRNSAVLSQWASASEKSLRLPRQRFRVPFQYDGGAIVCVLDYTSLWFVLKRNEFKVAIRACFDGQGIDSARMVTSGKRGCSFLVEGRTGQFAIDLEVLKEEREILRYKTALTPHRLVQMSGSARDLLLIGGTPRNGDAAGKVHFTQKGPASAIAYASFRDPKGGVLLYFQNLTALNEYCDLTHASPVGIVAGQWPEIGMALPSGSKPLPAKRQVTVSDAFVCFSDRVLGNETDVAEHCLESLASIYKYLPRPKTEYFDWPHAATKTLHSLENLSRHLEAVLAVAGDQPAILLGHSIAE
jgi:hypothetical protein